MNKKVKTLIIMALALGTLGSVMDLISPSINIDRSVIFDEKSSVDAMATAPIISAKGAVLIGANGEMLYEKDADKILYPASTTKIMTALLTLEILDEIQGSLDSVVEIPKDAVGIEGSSVHLVEGERVTVEELLYGTMLQSGNDAATALAMCMGGNVPNFVKMMNDKAKELGCTNTHFMNPSGLFDKNHYTTARDLAKISLYAMSNEAFRKIVGAKEWENRDASKRFVNKNKSVYQYDGATGIKIGYTQKSGRTLVASANREGKELIAVVLNDGNWFQDAYAMLDYGFEILEVS